MKGDFVGCIQHPINNILIVAEKSGEWIFLKVSPETVEVEEVHKA